MRKEFYTSYIWYVENDVVEIRDDSGFVKEMNLISDSFDFFGFCD